MNLSWSYRSNAAAMSISASRLWLAAEPVAGLAEAARYTPRNWRPRGMSSQNR
jgi:hypothetical protein